MNRKLTGSSLAVRLLATAGLMVATLMNTLDTTIANVALPHIQGSLSAAQDQITWVLTSYIVATAMMTPLTGWLSLKFGRKRLFLISIAAFVAASVLCGIATSLPEMVLFRLIQGIAGAAMMPLSQAAILDLFSDAVMPRVMAIWSAVIMVGPILGPTLGGLLTESYSWRWCFYINLPVGVAAFALVYLFLEADEGGKARPFDLIGFLALVLFTAGVQLVTDRGQGQDWFDSAEVCVEAIVAVIGLYVFVMQSLTAEHPFFHRALLADRNFVTSLVFSFFIGGMLLSTSALLPSFMQNLLGYTPLQSGMVSMYRGFGSIAAFTVVTQMAAKAGLRPTIIVGLAVNLVALWLMAHFDLMMTAAPIKLAGFIQGVGMGLMFNPLGVLGFATLPSEHRTEAAVFGNVIRTMAGSLGIAFVQTMLIRQSAAAHETLAAHIVPSDPVIRWAAPRAFDGAGGLEALNAEVTRQGAMIGYDAVFAGMLIVAALMLPLLLIMRPATRKPSELIEVHAD